MTRQTTSASNIFRRALCPGSERLEDGLPEESSAQSEEGVLLHKHMAEPELSRRKLPSSQRDLLNTAGRLVKEIFDRVQAQFGELPVVKTGGYERELWLHRGIRSLFPGHCDIWEYVAEKKLLVIIDHKFGYKVVTPAAANLQLRSYAVMGAEQHDCDHVVVAITQPRLPVDDRLTLAVYSRDDIKASRQQLYDIWDACKEPDAPLVAGEEQCRYCKARLICPAFKAKVEQGQNIVPFPSQGLSVPGREAFIAEKVAQASDEQLAQMHEAVTFAGFVREPLHDEIRRRIALGAMPGYRLGKESEVREVEDTFRAINALIGLGMTMDSIMPACKMALGKVEEAYRETHDGVTWKDARETINNALEEVIVRKPKKPAIEKVKALK